MILDGEIIVFLSHDAPHTHTCIRSQMRSQTYPDYSAHLIKSERAQPASAVICPRAFIEVVVRAVALSEHMRGIPYMEVRSILSIEVVVRAVALSEVWVRNAELLE